jgi:hypothetical protein
MKNLQKKKMAEQWADEALQMASIKFRANRTKQNNRTCRGLYLKSKSFNEPMFKHKLRGKKTKQPTT